MVIHRLAGVFALLLPIIVGSPASFTSTTLADCIEDGSGSLKVSLTGAHTFDVDWPNTGTVCHGAATRYGVGVHFGRTVAERSTLTVGFTIHDLAEGETGDALPVAVEIGGNAVGDNLFRAPRDACVVHVTEHAPLNNRGDTRAYRVSGRGSCDAPAPGMLGDEQISIDDFEFTGKTIWQ